MKSNDQAALDLFSNYSEFMLTDDELLIIHGGTTQGGTLGSGSNTPVGSSPSAPSAPMGPPPPPQPAPMLPPVQPVTVHVEATVKADVTHAVDTAIDVGHEVVHEAVEIVHGFHNSETVDAIDHFVGTAISAATNYLFGPSNNGGSGH